MSASTSTSTSHRGLDEPAPLRIGAWRGTSLGPWLALGVLLVVAAAELMYLSRGLYFNFDEWDFVLFRQGHSAAAFLKPHNEHVVLVPILIFKALFKVFGIANYWPYRLTNIVLVQATAALTYVYARPRIGAWTALVPAALVAFMGAAAEDVFWPFEMALEIPVLCALAVLVLFDHRPRLADPLACLLLTVAVFSSGVGLVVVAGAAVEVLARRDRWRRVWIIVIPLALYAAWWLGYHAHTDLIDNAPYAPRYDANALAAASGGAVALDADWGHLFALVLAVAVVWTVVRSRVVPVRLVTLCVLALAYWTSIALLRGPEAIPGQSRYLFVGSTLVIAIVVELLRGRVPPLTRAAAAVAALGVAVVSLGNLQLMREFLPFAQTKSRILVPELTAIRLARDVLPPDLPLDQSRVPGGTVGLWLTASDAYGAPHLGEAGLAQADPDGRKAVDFLLLKASSAPHLEQQKARYTNAGAPPHVVAATAGHATTRGSCVVFRAAQPGAALVVQAPAGGLSVRPVDGPATIGIRRFSDEDSPAGEVGPPMNGLLRIGPDRIHRPWTVTVTTGNRATVCTAT
jgi:hypothetical protein